MPSILAIWVASYIQKFFTKMTPDVIKVFVVPLFTLLITVPLTFLVVGPVANTLSDGLTNLFQAIMNFNPIVFGLVLGILWQVLVMFGMHWALIPLAISDVATNGSLSILSAALLPCFTQTGVLGAIMLKTKEEKVRILVDNIQRNIFSLVFQDLFFRQYIGDDITLFYHILSLGRLTID